MSPAQPQAQSPPPAHSLITRTGRHSRPSNLDRVAWRLLVLQKSPDEIAAKLHLSIDQVNDAIVRVQMHNASLSHEAVDLAINEEVLMSVRRGQLRTVLHDAMRAERTLITSGGVVTDAQGMPLTEPDHGMRLEAIKTLPSLLKSIRPTSAGVQINTAINNSNTQNNVIGGGRSFEARRRAAAERRGAVAVADAEEVEVGEESEEVLEGEIDDVELDDPDIAEETDDSDDE